MYEKAVKTSGEELKNFAQPNWEATEQRGLSQVRKSGDLHPEIENWFLSPRHITDTFAASAADATAANDAESNSNECWQSQLADRVDRRIGEEERDV